MVELQNFRGRSDLEINYTNRRIVIELKYVKDKSEVKAKLAQAITQIKERDYGNTLPLKCEILRIALVFAEYDREFVAYEVL